MQQQCYVCAYIALHGLRAQMVYECVRTCRCVQKKSTSKFVLYEVTTCPPIICV